MGQHPTHPRRPRDALRRPQPRTAQPRDETLFRDDDSIDRAVVLKTQPTWFKSIFLCCAATFAIVLFVRPALWLMSAIIGSSRGSQAFAMSLGAGAATGIGACFVLCTGSLNRTLLASTMSFSAGVMVYVSLVEVIAVADEYFRKGHEPPVAYALATLSFFAGVVIMAAVDAVVHRMFDAISGEHGSAHHGHSHGAGGGAEDGCDPESPPLCGSEASEFFDDEGGASIRALAHVQERQRLMMMSAVVCTASKRARVAPPNAGVAPPMRACAI